MAVTRNTPTLGLRGPWVLTMPFKTTANVLYRCTALSNFTQLVVEGIDIFTKYYEPLGLTEDKYKEDLAAGAVMCILYSDTGSVVTVPDTYIASYPGIGMSNWGQVILTASVGPIKLNTNLDFLKDSMADLFSDTIGIRPEIFVDLLDGSTALSQEEAAALEAARQSAITNRTTSYAENISLKKQLAEANNKIAVLLAAKK